MSTVSGITIAHVNLSRGYSSVERQTEILITALSQSGVPQILVCRDDSPMIKRLHGLTKLKIQRVFGVVDPKYLGHFKLGRKVQVVHAHDDHGARWALFHYVFFGVPYVVTIRPHSTLDGSLGTRLMLRWASDVVCVTTKLKQRLEDEYSVEATVIQHCCSNQAPNKASVDKIRESFKNRFIIGHIGPLVNRRKGQADLISAAKLLSERIPELVVMFIGGGDDLKLLKEKSRGMPNVHFLGMVRNTIDYISCMDAFAYTARDDDFGDAILEVINQHVPIVATDNGHLPDFIRHEVTALVVKQHEPEELAQAILRLKSDYELRERIKSELSSEAVRHSAELMSTNYIALYGRAAAEA